MLDKLNSSQPCRALRLFLTSPRYFLHVAALLFIGEDALNPLIIRFISYTEIDWVAYMQEVEGFLGGELDYMKLRGDTGPLVYPAGFLRFYAVLFRLTDKGRNVLLAQGMFAVIYLLTLVLVFDIYYSSRRIPPYALVFLTLSKRLHSIYVLRLFNDGVTMLALYACIAAMTRRMWSAAAVFFSFALSMKMNIFLFFPAYGVILFKCLGVLGTLNNLVVIAAVQVLLAVPFLTTHPKSYLSRAFEFSRAFFYKWTVNWRFVPEDVFLSRPFATALLVGHMTALAALLWGRWCREDGGVWRLVRRGLSGKWWKPASVEGPTLSADKMITMMFTSNLVGIYFARSLHYQFYSWYAHQTVYLAWRTRFPFLLRVTILMAIEYAWSVYPSTTISSLVLLAANSLLLGGVWYAT